MLSWIYWAESHAVHQCRSSCAGDPATSTPANSGAWGIWLWRTQQPSLQWCYRPACQTPLLRLKKCLAVTSMPSNILSLGGLANNWGFWFTIQHAKWHISVGIVPSTLQRTLPAWSLSLKAAKHSNWLMLHGESGAKGFERGSNSALPLF